MTPASLEEYREHSKNRRDQLSLQAAGLPPASPDLQSSDDLSDQLAEAIFLRAFISYELALETMFFHYVAGGGSISGRAAKSFLQPGDETMARRVVRAGFRFLNWAKPETIRSTANLYLRDGWPIADMMSARGQQLGDCERIRNRIAHNSPEAASEFKVVQRNLFGTERRFDITPGQLLRVRRRSSSRLFLDSLLTAMGDTIEAILDPPQ